MNATCLVCHFSKQVETALSFGDQEKATAFARELMAAYLAAPAEAGSPYFGPLVTQLLQRYFGVSAENFNLKTYLTEFCERTIKRELIFNYLCQKHNIGADEKTIAEEVQKLFQEEADYANAQDPSANYTAESVRKELEAQYGEGYFEEYVKTNLNSELLDDFLFSNYTVSFTEK